MTPKTPTAALPPWHRAALAKFYGLQAEAAGLRGSMREADDRLATIRRDRRIAENYLEKLRETISWAPVLQGRQMDRDITHAHVAETEAELERLALLEDEAQQARDRIAASVSAMSPVLNGASKMMVALKLITREEAAL